jgi:hypothetical protein
MSLPFMVILLMPFLVTVHGLKIREHQMTVSTLVHFVNRSL